MIDRYRVRARDNRGVLQYEQWFVDRQGFDAKEVAYRNGQRMRQLFPECVVSVDGFCAADLENPETLDMRS